MQDKDLLSRMNSVIPRLVAVFVHRICFPISFHFLLNEGEQKSHFLWFYKSHLLRRSQASCASAPSPSTPPPPSTLLYQKNPEFANMKDKQFLYYEDWLVLLGNNRATDAEAVDLFLAEENMNTEEYEAMNLDGGSFSSFNLPTKVDDDSSPTESTPTTSKGGKKRGRASDRVAKSIGQMMDTFESFFEKIEIRLAEIVKDINYEKDGREARKKLNYELLRLPLDPNDRMKALLAISKSNTLVDIFFSLDTDEDRMNFIQKI